MDIVEVASLVHWSYNWEYTRSGWLDWWEIYNAYGPKVCSNMHLIDTIDKRSHIDLQWKKKAYRSTHILEYFVKRTFENKSSEHSKISLFLLPVLLIIWLSVSASGSISDTNFHKFSRIFHLIFRGFLRRDKFYTIIICYTI